MVHGFLNELSAMPTQEATSALKALLEDAALGTYQDSVRRALANQQERFREVTYCQPNWEETLATLANGAPANVADLQVLVMAHLHDVRKQIDSGNTDSFKRFWNEDQYGRKACPKPEESCRDVLVDMLRPRVQPLGIAVEPEGHMARDKRADITVFFRGIKLVIELKRDYHADLWTAAENQLDRFYTRDPEAAGYGIYGVFWYGDSRPKSMAPSPEGKVPGYAAELERMLVQSVSAEKRTRIVIIIIDVSGD
jgi:hypothetical protein